MENDNVLMGMEYAGAVRMMVINEMVEINKRVSKKVDELLAALEASVHEQEDLDSCLEVEKEWVNNLEVQIIELERERHLLCWEVQSAKATASECILQMVELMIEV